MFWSWIGARLAVYGLRQKRRPMGGFVNYYPHTGVRTPDVRRFFECPNCSYFHAEAIQVNCELPINRWTLGTMPVGGPTATEVLFLNGNVEHTPKDRPWSDYLPKQRS